MSARAFYLDLSPHPVFCVFHPGAGGSAVLLCPPLGWEDVCSYRSRREWAEALAAAGHPTLRLDYPGTGDSGGGPDEAGQLERWTEAVAAAAAWLRAETRAERTCAIGIGVGGLVACRATAAGAPIDDLVLWGVPAKGKSLVRALRAFARIETSTIVEAGAPEPPPHPDGSMAPGGFLIAADTTAALEAVDLSAEALPDASDRRVLLLGADGISADEGLRAALEAAGAEVTVSAGEGYGEMMEKPDYARAPRTVFARTIEWLGAAAPPSRLATAEPPATTVTAEVRGVREMPLSIDAPGGGLFGILGEPAGPEDAEVCVVFLNAGAVRRVGPNRMWLEMARRWNGRGVPTLRVDLRGIGDSEGDGERYSEVANLYTPEFAAQVRRVLDELSARGVARRFVLTGLCSGAFWAYGAALEDDRVSAVILLNPRVLFWDDELEPERDARRVRRQLLRRSSWRRVFSGQIRMDRRRVAGIASWVAHMPLRVLRPKPRALDRVEQGFELLARRGTRAVLAFCESGEPLAEELAAAGHLDSTRWPNVEFHVIPGRDHTLRPLWMHQHVHELFDRALSRELAGRS